MEKVFIIFLSIAILTSCSKDDSSEPAYARRDLLRIIFLKNGENAVKTGLLDEKYFNVRYLVNGEIIQYPYANENFPKGYKIIDNEIVEVHLSSATLVDNKTLLTLDKNTTDIIRADFVKSDRSIGFTKVWYNNQIVFDSESTPLINPRYIEVSL